MANKVYVISSKVEVKALFLENIPIQPIMLFNRDNIGLKYQLAKVEEKCRNTKQTFSVVVWKIFVQIF